MTGSLVQKRALFELFSAPAILSEIYRFSCSAARCFPLDSSSLFYVSTMLDIMLVDRRPLKVPLGAQHKVELSCHVLSTKCKSAFFGSLL